MVHTGGMKLKDRVVIIRDDNMTGIHKLYGKCSFDDLERIVNSHIATFIEEIMEDSGMSDITKCTDCDFVKCYAVNRQIYYCDNVDRMDDMGKLGIDQLPERSPEWCPRRKIVGADE